MRWLNQLHCIQIFLYWAVVYAWRSEVNQFYIFSKSSCSSRWFVCCHDSGQWFIAWCCELLSYPATLCRWQLFSTLLFLHFRYFNLLVRYFCYELENSLINVSLKLLSVYNFILILTRHFLQVKIYKIWVSMCLSVLLLLKIGQPEWLCLNATVTYATIRQRVGDLIIYNLRCIVFIFSLIIFVSIWRLFANEYV